MGPQSLLLVKGDELGGDAEGEAASGVVQLLLKVETLASYRRVRALLRGRGWILLFYLFIDYFSSSIP